MLYSSRVQARISARIRYSVWLVRVSGYAHVFILLFVVIVTHPFITYWLEIIPTELF